MRLYAGLLRQQGPKKVHALVKRMLDHAVPASLNSRARCVALLNSIADDLRPVAYTI